jgi:hypothetical protein
MKCQDQLRKDDPNDKLLGVEMSVHTFVSGSSSVRRTVYWSRSEQECDTIVRQEIPILSTISLSEHSACANLISRREQIQCFWIG